MVPFHKAERSVSYLYDWKNKLLTYGVKQNVRLIQPNVIGGSEDGKPALRYHCKDTTLFVTTKLLVVVCLKTRTFAVSQTTQQLAHQDEPPLWFAWKIVLLQYRKQLRPDVLYFDDCCDLLEKSYFCSITNSFYVDKSQADAVVICLKNRTFAVSQTATY